MTPSASTVGLRERHKYQRRTRILDALRQLLRERPNETPTVERIAELADVSPATVFNLVGTHEQQWAGIVDSLLQELDARLALTVDEDPRERARRIVGETVEVFIADAAVLRHLFNSWGRSGILTQENPIPHLRAALRHGQKIGMLRSELHIDALAGHIAMAAGGAVRRWAGGQISDDAFRTYTRFAVDVVFAAGASRNYDVALHALPAKSSSSSAVSARIDSRDHGIIEPQAPARAERSDKRMKSAEWRVSGGSAKAQKLLAPGML